MTNLAKIRIQDWMIEEKRVQLIEDCRGGYTDFDTYNFVYPNDTSLKCFSWIERTFPFNEHCFFDGRL